LTETVYNKISGEDMSFYNAALISGLEEEVTGSDKTFKYTIKVLGAMAP
jgi:hypothetical protein